MGFFNQNKYLLVLNEEMNVHLWCLDSLELVYNHSLFDDYFTSIVKEKEKTEEKTEEKISLKEETEKYKKEFKKNKVQNRKQELEVKNHPIKRFFSFNNYLFVVYSKESKFNLLVFSFNDSIKEYKLHKELDITNLITFENCLIDALIKSNKLVLELEFVQIMKLDN